MIFQRTVILGSLFIFPLFAEHPGDDAISDERVKFSLESSIIVKTTARSERNRIVEEEIRPLWEKVLGPKVTTIRITVTNDSAWIFPKTPDGVPLRNIQYLVQGMAVDPPNITFAKKEFDAIILVSGLPGIFASHDSDGNTILITATTALRPTTVPSSTPRQRKSKIFFETRRTDGGTSTVPPVRRSAATGASTTTAGTPVSPNSSSAPSNLPPPSNVSSPIIKMNFPADFPGNDVLSQMIAGWSGVSGNKTEPNGTSTFSFGDPNLPAPGTESPLTDDTMTTMATPSGGLTTSTQNVNAVSAGTSIAGSRHRRTRTTTTPLVVTETAVRSAITTTSGHSSTVSGSDAEAIAQTENAPTEHPQPAFSKTLPAAKPMKSDVANNGDTGTISMNIPADFPGIDILNQIKVGWTGLAVNSTEANGSVTFRFGNPDSPPSLDATGEASGHATVEPPTASGTLVASGYGPAAVATSITSTSAATDTSTVDISDGPATRRSSKYPKMRTGEISALLATTITAVSADSTVTFASPDSQGIQIVAFTIGDVTVVSVQNISDRDNLLNNELKPLWRSALGPAVQDLEINIEDEKPWPDAPKGSNVRQIQYTAQGTAGAPVEADAVREDFHDQVIAAKLPQVWAVPDETGDLTILPVAEAAGVTTKATKPRRSRKSTTPITTAATTERPSTGATAKDLSIVVQKDSPFQELPDQPNLRRIGYQLQGFRTCNVDIPNTINLFHKNIAESGVPGVLGIPDQDGVIHPIKPSSSTDIPATTSTTSPSSDSTSVANSATSPSASAALPAMSTSETIATSRVPLPATVSPNATKNTTAVLTTVPLGGSQRPQAANQSTTPALAKASTVSSTTSTWRSGETTTNHQGANNERTVPARNGDIPTVTHEQMVTILRTSTVMPGLNTTGTLNVSGAVPTTIPTTSQNTTQATMTSTTNATAINPKNLSVAAAAPNSSTTPSTSIRTTPALVTTTPSPACINVSSGNNQSANPRFLGHRPSFAVNAKTDPKMFETLQLLKAITPIQSSFGMHKVALHYPIPSVPVVEEALKFAWAPLPGARMTEDPTVKIIALQDYGVFSKDGMPLVDVTYVVGMNRQPSRNPFSSFAMIIRAPSAVTLASRMLSRGLHICDCEIYDSHLLHLDGIRDLSGNLFDISKSLAEIWRGPASKDACTASKKLEVKVGIPVISTNPWGDRRRITTVPYVILLDGAVWYPSSDADVPASSAIQKVLDGSSLQLPVYNSSDVAPKSRLVSIEMSSTNIINRSIAYQDMAMAQTMLEDCFGYGNAPSTLVPALWNLEPVLHSQRDTLTQQAFFVTLPNNVILDPRLFPIRCRNGTTLKEFYKASSSVSAIVPVYIYGLFQDDQLETIIRAINAVNAETEGHPSNATDEKELVTVGYDYGYAPGEAERTGLKSEVTELRVSPKNDSSERGVLPELSAIAKLLQSPDFQDRWNKRLQSLSISLCRSCKFRRARSLNLIPLEGHQSRPMSTESVSETLFKAWSAANNLTNSWIPLNVTVEGRDDTFANENGTQVSRFTYTVEYPQPSVHWYIVRDPSQETFTDYFSSIHAAPFLGYLIQL